MTTLAGLLASPAVFEVADPPRAGHLTFWGPSVADADDIGNPGSLRVVVPADGHPAELVEATVPARALTVAEALPLLLQARSAATAHIATQFWSAATTVALQLVARGRLLPGVTPGGIDAWRVGPLDPADATLLTELAAAMPVAARAVALPDRAPWELPVAATLLRAFLDAVADALPRTPAAAWVAGSDAFAAAAPVQVPELASWAQDVAAGVDSGVRVSLRLELPDDDIARSSFRAVLQVHSLADPTLVRDVGDLWTHSGDADPADVGFGPRVAIDTMLAVRRAARIWEPLERVLRRAVPDELQLSDDEVDELLGAAATRLAGAGVDVHWPRRLARELTARAVVGRTEAPPSDLASFFGGDDLLRFDWQLALGGEPLTEAEMDALAEAHRPVVRLRDQWVLVSPELARKARDRALKPVTAIDAVGIALTGTTIVDGERVEVASSGWLDALRRRIADPEAAGADTAGAVALPPPATLRATLRDYQLRGFRWLEQMTTLGLGACLADDMGLGKTVTLIALHLHRQSDPATAGPTLVVCPASLLGNWEREIERFAPGSSVRRFHGAVRSLEETRADGGFVLTTYGTMRVDLDRLGSMPWGLVVADEAQHVKNPRSRTARALRQIGSRGRVALTGTPVENNLSELWAILDWTTPGLLGSLAAFRSRWATPIEGGAPEESAQTAQQLSRLVAPFLLRRRKSDPGIAPELPPKTETDRPVALTQEQAGLYEAVVRETLEQIRRSEGIERRGLVLKLLTALKQICDHPALYLKESPARLLGRSGKLELLDELVDTIAAEDGAVLVFTQYVSMARLLERHLTDRGVRTQLLHGGTPVARREQMVAQFQAGAAPVFLLSLRAAGTGLNLTRADHVVHFDRWWNPAVEEQASDRAYRIGQTRPVQVHRLIAEGTVEDRIAAMLETKRKLAAAVLGSGEAALSELTDAELADLVTLRSTT